VRPTLLELESRNEPTRLGLSIFVGLMPNLSEVVDIKVPQLAAPTPAATAATSIGSAMQPPTLPTTALMPLFTVVEETTFLVGSKSPEMRTPEFTTIVISINPAPAALNTATSAAAPASVSAVSTFTAQALAPATVVPNPVSGATTPITAPPIPVTTPTLTVGVSSTGTTPIASPVPQTPIAVAGQSGNFGGAAAAGTNASVIVPGALTLPGGGAIGSGLNAVPATVGPPAGAVTLPAAIVPTGTVTGGDATPAAEQPPVVQPDPAGGDGPSAAAAKGDEAPAIGTRLEAFLAALAAAAYGLWHWRRHSVKMAPPEGARLARRGTVQMR
jgi:hypothetical protein